MGLLLSVLVIIVWQADILTSILELAQDTPNPGQLVKIAVLHAPVQTGATFVQLHYHLHSNRQQHLASAVAHIFCKVMCASICCAGAAAPWHAMNSILQLLPLL